VVTFYGLIVVGLAVFAAIWWFQYKLRQRRIADLVETAQDLGFQFAERDPHGIIGFPFELFGRGDGRRVEHVMWGERHGLPLRVFDYWYYEESSDGRGNRSRTYHRYTCVVCTIGADCPALRIGHEGFFSRVGSALGFKDVELEYDDFNRQFRVRCDDQRFAFSLLDGRMMEWLLRVGGRDAGGVEILEIVGPFVLIAAPKLAADQWPVLVDVAEQFHAHVPRVVFATWPRDGS
jgi:hypothetical protein